MEVQPFLLCALSIALSVASVHIASYSVALSLYTVLSVALTTVHFDGTFILSLHSNQLNLVTRNTYLKSQYE